MATRMERSDFEAGIDYIKGYVSGLELQVEELKNDLEHSNRQNGRLLMEIDELQERVKELERPWNTRIEEVKDSSNS